MLSKNKSYILYIDTSNEEAVISVYLLSTDLSTKNKKPTLIKETKWRAHRELSATLSLKYLEILKDVGILQRDLSGIVIFSGPGSFTGLRIGISFANGLAYALGIPIYETKKKGLLDFNNPKEIAQPFYGSDPKITKPKTK